MQISTLWIDNLSDHLCNANDKHSVSKKPIAWSAVHNIYKIAGESRENLVEVAWKHDTLPYSPLMDPAMPAASTHCCSAPTTATKLCFASRALLLEAASKDAKEDRRVAAELLAASVEDKISEADLSSAAHPALQQKNRSAELKALER